MDYADEDGLIEMIEENKVSKVEYFDYLDFNCVERLVQALPQNNALRSIVLNQGALSEEDSPRLCRALCQLPLLEELSIQENGVGDAGAIEISKGLVQGLPLRYLRLIKASIGDLGAIELSKGVAVSHTLLKLYLDGNIIVKDGVTALAKVLEGDPTLQELSLSDNPLKQHGAVALSDMLRVNTTLLELSLRFDRFTDTVSILFDQSLDFNMTLQHLELGTTEVKQPRVSAEAASISVKLAFNRQRKFQQGLKSDGTAPWRRSKLMVVGEGRAGKTATVRSLLIQPFVENWNSTVGVALTNMITSKEKLWKQSQNPNFVVDLASRVAQDTDKPNVAGMKRQLSDGARKKIEDQFNKNLYGRRAMAPFGFRRGRYAAVPNIQGGGTPEQRRAYFQKQQEQQAEDLRKELEVAVPKVKESSREVIVDDTKEDAVYKYNEQLFTHAKEQKDSIRMTIWDYGGQDVFYTLHHVFLTQFGVYLIVFDMAHLIGDSSAVDYVEFWLNSIHLHAPEAPVLLVGTCLDKAPTLLGPRERAQLGDEGVEQHMVDSTEKILLPFVEQFKQIVRNTSEDRLLWPISNKEKFGIVDLRNSIETITESQDFVNVEVSIKWMKCLDSIISMTQQPWVETEKVMELFKEKEELSVTALELDRMLRLFHELGVLLYFSNTETLRRVVITKPEWLITAVSKVIRDYELHPLDKGRVETAGLTQDVETMFQTAVASRDVLVFLWEKEVVDYLIVLMRRLLLLSTWAFGSEDEPSFFVPSLLTQVCSAKEAQVPSAEAVFTFPYLHHGIFERLVCLALEYTVTKGVKKSPMLRAKHCKMWMDNDTYIVLKQVQSSISVFPSNDNKAADVLVVIRTLLRKLTNDFMASKSVYDISVRNGDKLVPWEDAVKQNLKPWVLQEVVTEENKTLIDNFYALL